MGVSQAHYYSWPGPCLAGQGALSHLERFGSWGKGLMHMWPVNFRLAFAGKAVVAKTIPGPKTKAVTAKKAESSSDSDSGNSREKVLIFC